MKNTKQKRLPAFKVSVRYIRLIKILHLYCACLWGGSTASVTLAQCLFQPKNASELYASSLSATYVDYYIIAPSAIGCLLTGLMYAAVTRFGFFKYRWIIFKWATTISYLIFGLLWYMPWLEKSVSNGLAWNASWIPVETIPDHVVRITLDVIQLFIVLAMVSVSVIKPWGQFKCFGITLWIQSKALSLWNIKTRGKIAEACHE